MKEKKYKHMTLDDRVEIQECLDKGMFFKDIAKRIEKDQTTVSNTLLKGSTIETEFSDKGKVAKTTTHYE